jgi:putative lipoprotein
MKVILGFVLFLLLIAGIAFLLRQGQDMIQLGGGGAEVTGIRWRPVTIGDEPIPENSGLYVEFEVDGSIKGHGGCNGFFGSLEQSESGIGVGPLGATRKACSRAIMSRETAFMDAVQKTRDFRTGGDSMSLLDEDSSVLARFVAGSDD